MRRLLLAVLLTGLCGCGLGSVHPVVTESDLLDEPRFAGTWQDPDAKESAVITMTGRGTYDIVYTEENGTVGHFHARLGTLGTFRVLDIQPQELTPPNASDTYRSLVLRAHGVLIVDSVGNTLRFRMVDSDSLRAYLAQHPNAAAHALTKEAVLLTASSPEVRRFLSSFLTRPGVLGEVTVWRRRTR